MRILIITHSDAAPDNAVTRDLTAMGHDLFWRRPALDELLPETDIDAAVSFGGPQYVTEIADYPWMQTEAEWITRFVKGGGHFLGICLGAQILAHGLGARIWRYDDHSSEIGVYEVTPTAEGIAQDFLPETAKFYQWHLEGFEVPEGGVSLASSDLFPQQAFRYGERAYGLQFHPEITEAMIDKWTTFVTEHKPEMFERPKTQPAPTHLTAWTLEADKIAAWRWNFLQNWLKA